MDLLKTILCLPCRTPERINVTIHSGGNGFDIPFPFGTIVVPDIAFLVVVDQGRPNLLNR